MVFFSHGGGVVAVVIHYEWSYAQWKEGQIGRTEMTDLSDKRKIYIHFLIKEPHFFFWVIWFFYYAHSILSIGWNLGLFFSFLLSISSTVLAAATERNIQDTYHLFTTLPELLAPVEKKNNARKWDKIILNCTCQAWCLQLPS